MSAALVALPSAKPGQVDQVSAPFADPAFAAARALDLASAAHAEAFTAWAGVLSVFDPDGLED